MKLLGSTKKVLDKDKNGENVSKLESVELALVHCNLVKNYYQQASKVIVNDDPINPVILVSIWTIKIVNAEKN